MLLQPENRTRVNCISMKHLFCNALVRVIYSAVSGQCIYMVHTHRVNVVHIYMVHTHRVNVVHINMVHTHRVNVVHINMVHSQLSQPENRVN